MSRRIRMSEESVIFRRERRLAIIQKYMFKKSAIKKEESKPEPKKELRYVWDNTNVKK